MSASTFARFYADAADFPGGGLAALAAIVDRGAIWYEPATDRALVMDSLTARRFEPAGGAGAVIAMMVNGGALRADGLLEEGVNIYAPGVAR